METAATCFLPGLLLPGLACFAYGQPLLRAGLPGATGRAGAGRGAASGAGLRPRALVRGAHHLLPAPLYFCARYKHLSYYLYVSQTPAGCLVSSWTYSKYIKGEGEPRFSGFAAYRYFSRQTLFQFDAALMFSESLHSIVMDVLDRYI